MSINGIKDKNSNNCNNFYNVDYENPRNKNNDNETTNQITQKQRNNNINPNCNKNCINKHILEASNFSVTLNNKLFTSNIPNNELKDNNRADLSNTNKEKDVCGNDNEEGNKSQYSPNANEDRFPNYIKQQTRRVINTDQGLTCNILNCINCHGSSAREFIKLRKENKLKNQIYPSIRKRRAPRNKYCKSGECAFCNKIIERFEDILWTIAASQPTQTQIAEEEAPEDINFNEHTNQVENLGSKKSHPAENELNEFTEISTPKDGNCFFHALLALDSFNNIDHKQLRLKTVEWLKALNLKNEQISEDGLESVEEYLEKMMKDGCYANSLEATAIALANNIKIKIFMADKRYADPSHKEFMQNRWITVQPNNNIQTSKTLHLKLLQGHSRGVGHYTALVPNSDIIREKDMMDIIEEKIPSEDTEEKLIKVAIFNIRSLRSITKKNFLSHILYDNEIKIALIQETWLDENSQWYQKGYRIYRANNPNNRKGVAVLISNDIKLKAKRIQHDPDGRFLKVTLQKEDSTYIKTIGCAYLEPSNQENISIIPSSVRNSDIFAGDLNKAMSGLTINGVYHFNGITYTESIKIPNSISDHSILLGTCRLKTEINESTYNVNIIDKSIANNNLKKIIDKLRNHESECILEDPKKSITIQNTTKTINIDNIEEWNQMIQNEKERNKLNKVENYRLIGRMMQIGKIDASAWSKINNALRLKRKSEIWKPEGNIKEVMEGFKELYKDKGTKPCKLNTLKDSIVKALGTISDTMNNTTLPLVHTPRSSAKDFNGFSHQDIFKIIQGDNLKQQFLNFQFFLNTVWKIENGRKLVLHRTSRVILFKKIPEIVSYKDLRPISIMPAVIITLEKLIAPVVKIGIKGKISNVQFGFKEDSGINFAKLRLAFLARYSNLNRALLIDLRKAYDSVDLDLLITEISNLLNDTMTAQLLIDMIRIYKLLNFSINGELVEPQIGLPQGSALSPILFNIYINGILETTTKNNLNINLQAYADDLIMQGNTMMEIQLAFDELLQLIQSRRMQINTQKCEYISQDKDEVIMIDGSDETIPAVDSARYLGQVINEEATPIFNITKKDLGKIIEIMNAANSLTRKSRIKIFKIYSRSRIGHLIPLLAVTKNLGETWKTIRSVIFNSVLQKSTLPRETASLLKIGFYNILVRPTLKIYLKIKELDTDTNMENFLLEATINAMKQWLESEPNHTTALKTKIIDMIDRKIVLSVEDLDKWIRADAIERLFRGTTSLGKIENLQKIQEPEVLLYLSNAPKHMVEENVRQYNKKDVDDRDQSAKAINEIVIKYLLGVELMKSNIPSTAAKPDGKTDTISWLEYLTIKEVRLEQFAETILPELEENASRITSDILATNSELTNPKDAFVLTKDFKDLIEAFRLLTIEGDSGKWENIEIVITSQFTKGRVIKDIKKKQVGRPKGHKRIEKEMDDIRKKKTQRTLDEFGF